MLSSRARSTVLTVLGIILLVVSALILGGHYFGQGRVGPALSSAPLPPGLSPALSSAPAPTASRAPVATRSPVATRTPVATRAPVPVARKVVANRPGTPVAVIVADHRVTARVSADRLNADGSLFVPADPRAVSWASQDAAPGSPRGTVILVGHVNFGGVKGAFSDLAEYRAGQIITLVLADGRRLRYAVAAPPIEVNKDDVGARRQELFDQSQSYGLSGRPRSGRLLLLSCGGAFDNRTGHYESNVFVYALPV